MLRIFSLLLCVAFCSSAMRVAGAEAITSIEKIRSLKPEEFGKGLPVRLEGVVTYCRADGMAFFIQEGEQAICCVLDGKEKFPLRPGHRVEIQGQIVTGGYSPAISMRRWKDLGEVPIPKPFAVELSQIRSGGWDSRYVEVIGVVRSVQRHETGQLTIDIASGGDRVTVTVEHGTDVDETKWVDGIVRVRGVVGSVINKSGQLVSAALRSYQMNDVSLELAPPGAPFAVDEVPIKRLMRFSRGTKEGHRVKVTGTVLHQQEDGTLFVQDASGGVMVECRPPATLKPGDQVEVLGFPAWGSYSPKLEDATFRKTGSGPVQMPEKVTSKDLGNGDLDETLVEVEGTLVEMSRTAGEQALILKCGDELLPAYLEASSSALDKVRMGSLVRLTGICRAKIAEKQLRTGKIPTPKMELLLRSADDVTVLQSAPWWNLQRALWLACGISALLLSAMVWALLLRRRVRKQTAIIADKLRAQSTYEERARVARELHDTVEQNLAGVAMHLDVIQNYGPPLPEVARENLDIALKQVRRTQEDTHRAVWDLRSPTLSESGLAAALEETLAFTVGRSEVAAQCLVTGSPRRLETVVEHHLLRIAQEAITNAVHHGKPSAITVTLDYESEAIVLRVADDGGGFDVDATTQTTQRLGLLGMGERAARIGANLSVRSKPQQGTVVEVTLPMHVSSPPPTAR